MSIARTGCEVTGRCKIKQDPGWQLLGRVAKVSAAGRQGRICLRWNPWRDVDGKTSVGFACGELRLGLLEGGARSGIRESAVMGGYDGFLACRPRARAGGKNSGWGKK